MLTRFTIAMFTAAALASCLQAATVTVVPDLYNGKLPVLSELMPDGKSIMCVAGDEVFRWTPAGGRVVLGSLGPRVLATAISADGTTVIGRRVSLSDQEAIRWTAAGGLSVLPRSTEFPHNPSPTHVSADGSIVYGTAHTHFTQPFGDLFFLGEITHLDPDYFPDLSGREDVFRWDSTTGSQSLSNWNADSSLMIKSIDGISADGEIIAGTFDGIPTIWSNTAGHVQPADLPDNFRFARVEKLSADGNTAIGVFYKTRFFQAPYAFRWSTRGNFEPLFDSIDGFSNALAVTANGQIILGHGDGAGSTFVWTITHGIQSLTDYFATHGVTLPFDGIHSAFQMSQDGLVWRGGTTQPIVRDDGSVTYSTIPWTVDLSAPAPEPTTLAVALIAILFLAAHRQVLRFNY